MEIDRVKGAVHRGQGMILRQESGMHPHFNGVAIPLGNGQELEHIAHFLATGNVHGRNPRDAFAVHRLKGYPGMEGQRGHDGQLVGGIQSFHVAGRVRLRQAQLLRVLQHGVIALALGGHAAENVVGGAVDNAHELGNAVGLERLISALMMGIARKRWLHSIAPRDWPGQRPAACASSGPPPLCWR